FYDSVDHRDLHSFPTRRSSDLVGLDDAGVEFVRSVARDRRKQPGRGARAEMDAQLRATPCESADDLGRAHRVAEAVAGDVVDEGDHGEHSAISGRQSAGTYTLPSGDS